MTPTEYEFRCAEMLRANAHNMSDAEIERFAFGAGEPIQRMLAVQNSELVHGCLSFQSEDDSLEFIIDDAKRVIR
jgi:hypothetical protein